jgi:legumain
MKFVVAAILLLAIAAIASAENWAILVAGSNGYYNYRHQSDVFHAFQILKKNGIPASNIIMMFYDDIANNSQNPKKGTVINEPNGPNVYTPDIPKDYTGNLVTPQNFLKILRGESMAGIGSGKTLKSGPNDKVFVYWTDHGGPGIIAFPNGVLHASELITTLKYMKDNNKYKELVFYLEACESGSMFDKLIPNNWNIYVTTASNPYESSYACYYDSTYRAYLDDCYSINWMNDTEYSNVNSRTLNQQFLAVKTRTTQSHVCQYGDLSIASEVLAEFQAGQAKKRRFAKKPLPALKEGDVVSSRDVKTTVLERVLGSANLSPEERALYEKEYAQHVAEKARADTIFGAFAFNMKLHRKETPRANADDRCNSAFALDVERMKEAVEAYISHCGMFTEESIGHAAKIRDAIELGYSPLEIEAEFAKICTVVKSQF